MNLTGAPVAVVVLVLAVAGCTANLDPFGTPAASSTPDGTPSASASVALHERPLTAGEVALARTVFGDAIDYSVVLVHNHGYPLLGGFQPDDVAVTPNGEMYFPAPSHLADFSAGSAANARWFVHEMVHVWQYQLGYPVAAKGMNRGALDYSYELDATARLADYDMEQQGEIIADYVAMTTLGIEASRDWCYFPSDLPLYETVLAVFLADPSDTASLPNR